MIIFKDVGNTPMIKIRYRYNLNEYEVFAKLESYNPTRSIKDRVAWYIVNEAKRNGELKEGMPIIEATSGNTGIALAALGALNGHEVYIFMPDWASKERVELMKSFGAKVKLISKEEGGFIRCVNEAKSFSNEVNGFLANQFSNKANTLAHYETTGSEILSQINAKIGAFISGVGNGGTLMGDSKRLKEENEGLLTIAIEPEKMPLLSGGNPIANHKIEGIGDDFIPELVERERIDKVILINDDDAINMSRLLAKKLGLGVGISSGANFLGCVLTKTMTPDAVVTVFADDNKKYLSTDLSKSIDNNESFLSNKIELFDFEFVK